MIGDIAHEQCAACILVVLRWDTNVDLDMHVFKSTSTSAPAFTPDTVTKGSTQFNTEADRLFWNSKTFRENPTTPIWGGVIYNLADDSGAGPESMGFTAGTQTSKYHIVINPFASSASIPSSAKLFVYTSAGLSRTISVPSTVTSTTQAWYVGYVDRTASGVTFTVDGTAGSPRRRLTNGPPRLDGPAGAAGYPNPAAPSL
jgi:hypothetical protein